MCLSHLQIQDLGKSRSKSAFSQKDTYLAFSFLFLSVLLSHQHHLKAKFRMYFAQPSFGIFEWCDEKSFRSVENNLLSWIFLNPRFGIVRWKIIFISGLPHIQCMMEKFGQSRVPVALEKRQTRWCNFIVIKKLPSFECSFGQIYFL